MNKIELKEQNQWLKDMKQQQHILIMYLVSSEDDFLQLLFQEGKTSQQSEELLVMCKKIEQDILSNLKKTLQK